MYANAEKWTDSSGRALAPDRFWNTTMESMIASDDSGPCMGIELNIWERAKVGIHFNYIVYTVYIQYIIYCNYTNYMYCRYDGILCTVW